MRMNSVNHSLNVHVLFRIPSYHEDIECSYPLERQKREQSPCTWQRSCVVTSTRQVVPWNTMLADIHDMPNSFMGKIREIMDKADNIGSNEGHRASRPQEVNVDGFDQLQGRQHLRQSGDRRPIHQHESGQPDCGLTIKSMESRCGLNKIQITALAGSPTQSTSSIFPSHVDV